MAMHLLNIQFARNEDITWPKPYDIKGTSINKLLSNHPKAHIYKQQLNQYQIYYIEQFFNHMNNELLNWNSIHHNFHKIPRGCILK